MLAITAACFTIIVLLFLLVHRSFEANTPGEAMELALDDEDEAATAEATGSGSAIPQHTPLQARGSPTAVPRSLRSAQHAHIVGGAHGGAGTPRSR